MRDQQKSHPNNAKNDDSDDEQIRTVKKLYKYLSVFDSLTIKVLM